MFCSLNILRRERLVFSSDVQFSSQRRRKKKDYSSPCIELNERQIARFLFSFACSSFSFERFSGRASLFFRWKKSKYERKNLRETNAVSLRRKYCPRVRRSGRENVWDRFAVLFLNGASGTARPQNNSRMWKEGERVKLVSFRLIRMNYFELVRMVLRSRTLIPSGV